MFVENKVFNLPHGLVKELRELSEVTDTQTAIRNAIAFYVKCLKFQQDGNIIMAVPFRVTKRGDFEADPKKVGLAIVITD